MGRLVWSVVRCCGSTSGIKSIIGDEVAKVPQGVIIWVVNLRETPSAALVPSRWSPGSAVSSNLAFGTFELLHPSSSCRPSEFYIFLSYSLLDILSCTIADL